MGTRAPSAPPLDAEQAARLVSAAQAARENNQPTEFMDAANRHWFVGCENVKDHGHVLIQVRRGSEQREVYLRTDTFTPEAAASAIEELHGAMP